MPDFSNKVAGLVIQLSPHHATPTLFSASFNMHLLSPFSASSNPANLHLFFFLNLWMFSICIVYKITSFFTGMACRAKISYRSHRVDFEN